MEVEVENANSLVIHGGSDSCDVGGCMRYLNELRGDKRCVCDLHHTQVTCNLGSMS